MDGVADIIKICFACIYHYCDLIKTNIYRGDPMPNIRPISDLRNNFNLISDICHKEHEPVFITKNGFGDMVVMSHSLYEEQQALLELYEKLAVAEEENRSNAPMTSAKDMFNELRRMINE